MIEVKTLLIALLLGLIKLEFSVLLLYQTGVNPTLVFLIVLIWSTVVTVGMYYLADLLKFLIEALITFATGEKKNSWIDRIWFEKVKKPVEKKRKSVIQWLLVHNKIIIFLIILIPFTFVIADIAVMATRVGKIKYGLILVIGANVGKISILVYYLYHIIGA